MGKVQVAINDRRYAIGCEDGQEAHLEKLARYFDGHVRKLAADIGDIGDQRLFLMAALIIADELYEANQKLASLEAEANRRGAASEPAAAAALNAAAIRVEALTARLAR